MGLSHLDAEVVNWFSSAYKCTTESQFAAKKSHKKKKRLSHLDAEVVNWFSSAYACTSESQFAAKKSHKKRKTVDKTDGFQHIKGSKHKF